MATKPASRKRCPECRRRRIGAFRYCRSCGFDFEGAAVHRPVAGVLTLAANASSANGPPDAEPAWLTFAPLSPEPTGERPPRPAPPAPRSPTEQPPVTAGPARTLGERLSTAWQESESVHRLSGRWLVVMLVLVAAVAVAVALFLGQLL